MRASDITIVNCYIEFLKISFCNTESHSSDVLMKFSSEMAAERFVRANLPGVSSVIDAAKRLLRATNARHVW